MSVLLSLMVLMAAPDAAHYSPGNARIESPPRANRNPDRAVHAVMRRWATPSQSDLQPAVCEVLALCNDLQRDTATTPRSRQDPTSKLRDRLTGPNHMMRAASQDKRTDAVEHAGALGQRIPGGLVPGAAAAGGGFGPGANASQDAGDDLADLIQRVISPASWERMGGPGSISYWPPHRTLVARAPAHTQGRTADLLDKMRE